MKEIILNALVAPITESIDVGDITPRDMNRVLGFSHKFDEPIREKVLEIFDDFETVFNEENMEAAEREMMRMQGYLEGVAASLDA